LDVTRAFAPSLLRAIDAQGPGARGHSVFHDGQWFNVYCFAETADAEKFLRRFGEEKFDPKQKGKGSSWARWKR
jgi:hypothetical protein